MHFLNFRSHESQLEWFGQRLFHVFSSIFVLCIILSIWKINGSRNWQVFEFTHTETVDKLVKNDLEMYEQIFINNTSKLSSSFISRALRLYHIHMEMLQNVNGKIKLFIHYKFIINYGGSNGNFMFSWRVWLLHPVNIC